MNTRKIFSALLLSLGLLLALLPLTSNRSFTGSPDAVLEDSRDEARYFTVDQVARFIVSEDTTIRLIDLRTPAEYLKMSLPGSVNMPYDQLLTKDPSFLFGKKDIRTIFYSNGELKAGYALAVALGLNHDNAYVMKGGLNEWYNTVMNSNFTGDRISARENALFETRSRAKRLFIELNSLPDSLKLKYLIARQGEAKKLDGGCE